MQERYSGNEPMKAEIFTIEIIQELLKKTGGGKSLKAKLSTIWNVQKLLKKLVVVER